MSQNCTMGCARYGMCKYGMCHNMLCVTGWYVLLVGMCHKMVCVTKWYVPQYSYSMWKWLICHILYNDHYVYFYLFLFFIYRCAPATLLCCVYRYYCAVYILLCCVYIKYIYIFWIHNRCFSSNSNMAHLMFRGPIYCWECANFPNSNSTFIY